MMTHLLHSSPRLAPSAALLCLLAATACGDSTGPEASGTLTVGVFAELPSDFTAPSGLLADTEGRLWVRSDEGRLASVSTGGDVTVVNPTDIGLPGAVDALGEGEAGTILVSSGTTIAELALGTWSILESELPGPATHLARGADGSILAVVGEGEAARLHLWADGVWTERPFFPQFQSPLVRAILPTPDSAFMVTTDEWNGNHPVIRVEGPAIVTYRSPDDAVSGPVRDMALRPTGFLIAQGEGGDVGGVSFIDEDFRVVRVVFPGTESDLANAVLSVGSFDYVAWFTTVGSSDFSCPACVAGIGRWDGQSTVRWASGATSSALDPSAILTDVYALSSTEARVLDAATRRILRVSF